MATQLEKSLRQAGSGKATVSVYRETRLHAENAGQASTAEERQASVAQPAMPRYELRLAPHHALHVTSK